MKIALILGNALIVCAILTAFTLTHSAWCFLGLLGVMHTESRIQEKEEE